MPAIERAFSATLPRRLYLDTDIVISFLFATEPHNGRAVSFLRRAAIEGNTQVYISSLTWIEFVHAITREAFRLRLPLPDQRRLRVARWGSSVVREAYVEAFSDAFGRLLDLFVSFEMEVTADVRAAATAAIARYNLGAQDAVHIATAQRAGIADFASFDARFRRVDDLVLWNDRIHVRP